MSTNNQARLDAWAALGVKQGDTSDNNPNLAELADAAELARLQVENERLRKALREQTEAVRKWRNRAHDQRKRRNKLLKRLGFGVHEDDSVVGRDMTTEKEADR